MNGVHSIVHHDDERVVAWCHDQDVQEVPENHGLPWTVDQDRHLLRCYKKQWPLLAIARFLKRNCYAIVCRLQKQGLDWRKVMYAYWHVDFEQQEGRQHRAGLDATITVKTGSDILKEIRARQVSEIRSDRQMADVRVTGMEATFVIIDEVSNFPFHPKEKVMKENINGRFWMIQNGDIKVAGNGLHVKDKFGRSMVEWPGRSIFPTKAEAVLVAKDMAARFPDSKFYVMEATSVHETVKPPVKSTTFKSR